MQINADSPYVKRSSWPKVLNTSSNIIIIMLGTNDSKTKENNGPPNWENDGVTGTDECECICFIIPCAIYPWFSFLTPNKLPPYTRFYPQT